VLLWLYNEKLNYTKSDHELVCLLEFHVQFENIGKSVRLCHLRLNMQTVFFKDFRETETVSQNAAEPRFTTTTTLQ